MWWYNRINPSIPDEGALCEPLAELRENAAFRGTLQANESIAITPLPPLRIFRKPQPRGLLVAVATESSRDWRYMVRFEYT